MPLLREYTHYALTRYFKEFAAVGLYACPGESIDSKYQLELFRDIIFDAARKSGKNQLIVIRDWTTNMEFRDQIKDHYDNVYTELKHNDESLSSPYPDLRHFQLEGVAPQTYSKLSFSDGSGTYALTYPDVAGRNHATCKKSQFCRRGRAVWRDFIIALQNVTFKAENLMAIKRSK